MIDKSDIYCEMPWNSMFHQLNNNTPCHTNRNMLQQSPLEYLNSDLRKSFKEKFSCNEFPAECSVCSHRESMGLQSTRTFAIAKKNELYPDIQKFTPESQVDIERLELRFSNLCNFKCRICEPYSSSEIAKEIQQYPELNLWNATMPNSIVQTDAKNISELKLIAKTIKKLCLTGGEPLLIKQYYDFLDYIIDIGRAPEIDIELFTNCSVYNPKFMERLEKFKSVNFIMSIDGVGKVAEYVRKGTDWATVEQNILRYASLRKPFNILYNTAISQYTLFDMASLAKFLFKLYELNPELDTRCYTVLHPSQLHPRHMSIKHRKIAVEQIDIAVEILKPKNFRILTNELLNLKNMLLTTTSEDTEQFIKLTEQYDRIRGESFEETFGFSLR